MRTMLLLVALLAFAGTGVWAQDRVSFGLAGGATLTLGELEQAGARSGFNLMLIAAIRAEHLPAAVRLDGTWSRFAVQDPTGTNLDLIAITANVSYFLPVMLLPRLYVIGGPGVYNWRTQGRTVTNFGANAGVGATLPLAGVAVFLETRFHQVFSDDYERILPISLGITF